MNQPALRQGGLRARKKRETRRRLIDASRQLFSERGFEATTIEAIADMAGVSKPTVFNYFSSKRALLHELVSFADQRFARLIDEVERRGGTFAKQLETFFLGLADVTEFDPSLSRVMMVEAVKAMSGEVEGHASEHHRFARAERGLVRLLKAGVERGEVRTDYSTLLMAQLILGSYTNILLWWLADPHYKVRPKLRQSARFLGEAVRPR